MRNLVLLILLAHLSGCVWLPIPDDDSLIGMWSAEDWESLMGRDIGSVEPELPGGPRKEVTENGRRHIVFTSYRDFGFLFAAAPYSAAGGFIGEQAACYRFSFDGEGRLYQIDQKYSTNVLDFDGLTDLVDCRYLFWTVEELAEIRRSQEALAAEGDKEAALIMLREYGDSAPLNKLVIATKDISLARMLAEEYGDFGPLTELAHNDAKADKQLELLSRTRRLPRTDLAGLSAAEINTLAHKGDAEAQFSLYWGDAEAPFSFYYRQYQSRSDPSRLLWLCRAADQGHYIAQYRLGDLYSSENTELKRNLPLSFVWYKLSAVKGVPVAKAALESVKSAMTQKQLTQAEQLYIDWTPGQCEIEIEQNRFNN